MHLINRPNQYFHFLYGVIVLLMLWTTGCSQYKLSPKVATPKLVKMATRAELPKVAVAEITSPANQVLFPHRSGGMILYHSLEDRCQLYQYVEGYEDKGAIRNIQVQGNTAVVQLENAGMIIVDNQPFVTDIIISQAFITNDQVVCLGIGAQEVFFDLFHNKYKSFDHLLLFDSLNQQFKTIDLRTNYSHIHSSAFHQGKIWVSTMSGDQLLFWNLFEIDLNGKVTKHNVREKLPVIQHVISGQDGLYLMDDSNLFMLMPNDSLKHIVQIDDLHFNDCRYSCQLQQTMKGLYLYPLSNGIQYFIFNMKNGNWEKVIVRGGRVSYPNKIILGNYIFCSNEGNGRVDKFDLNPPHHLSKYPIWEGITAGIHDMIEDQQEIWFLSRTNGLTCFSRVDSTWENYCLKQAIQVDSTHFFVPYHLHCNDHYLFMLSDGSNHVLVFDRQQKIFKLVHKNELETNLAYAHRKMHEKMKRFIPVEDSQAQEALYRYLHQEEAPQESAKDWLPKHIYRNYQTQDQKYVIIETGKDLYVWQRSTDKITKIVSGNFDRFSIYQMSEKNVYIDFVFNGFAWFDKETLYNGEFFNDKGPSWLREYRLAKTSENLYVIAIDGLYQIIEE